VEDDLDLKPARAGLLFRAEMFTTNVLLGYWRVFVSVVVVVLLAILLYGQYRTWNRRSQRGTAAEVAQALAALPAPVEELPARIASGEAIDPATLVKTADEVVALAESGRGTARAEGLLLASELYRIAGQTDQQRAALDAATTSARRVLAFAAEEGLANIDLAGGKGDEAVARLRKLAEGDSFLAEQATIDLGLALEHLGRTDEAAKVYADFLTRWPDSPRTDRVQERQSRLGQGAAG
jgi:hypothetical protein